jgi:hypothetical protein
MQPLTGLNGLRHTGIGKRRIRPAGESIFLVPLALGVANQDNGNDFISHGIVSCLVYVRIHVANNRLKVLIREIVCLY